MTAWESWRAHWADIRADWTRRARAIAREAEALLEVLGEDTSPPAALFDQARATVAALDRVDAITRRARDAGWSSPELDRIERDAAELRAGVYTEAQLADGASPQVQGLPFVVGAVVLGVAGVAFAVAAYPAAAALRVRAETELRELEIRAQAMREGRTLQPHTLPEPGRTAGRALPVVLGLGAVAALALWWGAR